MFALGIVLIVIGVCFVFFCGIIVEAIHRHRGASSSSWTVCIGAGTLGLSFLVLGILAIFVSSRNETYNKIIGKPAPAQEVGSEIWKVKGQIKVCEDQYVAVIENGEGTILCVEMQEQFPADATFAKLEEEWATGKKSLKPVSK